MILLSPEICKVKLDTWHGVICFSLLSPQMRLVPRSRRGAPLTPASTRHVSRSLMQCSLSSAESDAHRGFSVTVQCGSCSGILCSKRSVLPCQ